MFFFNVYILAKQTFLGYAGMMLVNIQADRISANTEIIQNLNSHQSVSLPLLGYLVIIIICLPPHQPYLLAASLLLFRPFAKLSSSASR